jgi:superfamily II DNA or RNA helicase
MAFEQGTLVLDPPELPTGVEPPEGFLPDPRIGGRYRAPAIVYRRALASLLRGGAEVDDKARAYEELALQPRHEREPFPHQTEALDAWLAGGRRGVVVLPTGAGKSYVAVMAMAQTGRSTLIVVPTIDLMSQWMNLLASQFGHELVGGLGGGLNDIRPITVTTYDSAYIHMPRLGGRFALVIFDECHHLPGPSYAQAAECAIAPFRLGLTATPERSDGGHEHLDRLVGPRVYERGIDEMRGTYLADYEVARLRVHLTPEEREAHDECRARYRGFVAGHRIAISSPKGWSRFIQESSRSRAGRRAWLAWREQKRIALQCGAKMNVLADLLWQHREDPVIVFTADNDTVHAISRRHLIPAITHQTPTDERRWILSAFNDGTLPAVVTSRVLNEGVDMPAAQVAIVLSGSGSVREHVQRLGRILRRHGDKEAMLYEVITAGTSEEYTSDRRREHRAYATRGDA